MPRTSHLLRYLLIPADRAQPVLERIQKVDNIRFSCDSSHLVQQLLKDGPVGFSPSTTAPTTSVLSFPTYNECLRDNVPLFFFKRSETRDKEENLRAKELLDFFADKLSKRQNTFYGDVLVFWRRNVDELKHQMKVADFTLADYHAVIKNSALSIASAPSAQAAAATPASATSVNSSTTGGSAGAQSNCSAASPRQQSVNAPGRPVTSSAADTRGGYPPLTTEPSTVLATNTTSNPRSVWLNSKGDSKTTISTSSSNTTTSNSKAPTSSFVFSSPKTATNSAAAASLTKGGGSGGYGNINSASTSASASRSSSNLEEDASSSSQSLSSPSAVPSAFVICAAAAADESTKDCVGSASAAGSTVKSKTEAPPDELNQSTRIRTDSQITPLTSATMLSTTSVPAAAASEPKNVGAESKGDTQQVTISAPPSVSPPKAEAMILGRLESNSNRSGTPRGHHKTQGSAALYYTVKRLLEHCAALAAVAPVAIRALDDLTANLGVGAGVAQNQESFQQREMALREELRVQKQKNFELALELQRQEAEVIRLNRACSGYNLANERLLAQLGNNRAEDVQRRPLGHHLPAVDLSVVPDVATIGGQSQQFSLMGAAERQSGSAAQMAASMQGTGSMSANAATEELKSSIPQLAEMERSRRVRQKMLELRALLSSGTNCSSSRTPLPSDLTVLDQITASFAEEADYPTSAVDRRVSAATVTPHSSSRGALSQAPRCMSTRGDVDAGDRSFFGRSCGLSGKPGQPDVSLSPNSLLTAATPQALYGSSMASPDKAAEIDSISNLYARLTNLTNSSLSSSPLAQMALAGHSTGANSFALGNSSANGLPRAAGSGGAPGSGNSFSSSGLVQLYKKALNEGKLGEVDSMDMLNLQKLLLETSGSSLLDTIDSSASIRPELAGATQRESNQWTHPQTASYPEESADAATMLRGETTSRGSQASTREIATTTAKSEGRRYKVSRIYQPEEGSTFDFANLGDGELVTVLKKHTSGWWWVRSELDASRVGWYPYHFLESVVDEAQATPAKTNSLGADFLHKRAPFTRDGDLGGIRMR